MQQQNSGAMISSPTTTSARFHMSRDDKAVLESDEELKETVQHVPLKILGLCGGIGSGKSYASSLLVSSLQCVAHINVDTLAHGVYSPGNPAVEEIKREFNEVVGDDGIVNRADLGRIVFSDPEAMSVKCDDKTLTHHYSLSGISGCHFLSINPLTSSLYRLPIHLF